MKKPQKAAAEAEAQSRRGFRFIKKGGIIQLQLLQRIPQIRILGPVRRIHTAVYHGIYLLITWQRVRAGIPGIRHRIAHSGILYIFNGSGNIANHSGR